MPQTLLAFLAMILVTAFSLVYQRSMIDSRKQMIQDEMETLASGVALELFEYIGSRDFDAQTANGTVTPENPDPALLTPLPFSGVATFEEAQDIDDFHGLSFTRTFRVDDVTFDFDVTVEVYYVDPQEPEEAMSTPTLAKKVVLTLTNKHMIRPLTISRVFTYP